MSVVYNITADELIAAGYRPIHAGDSYSHRFTLQRGGIALPLIGATKIWFTVKDDAIVPDSEAKLQLDSSDSAQIEITEPTNGKIVVKFVGSGAKTTEDLEGLWEYDCQVKLDDGEIITVFHGKIEFLANITRATS